LPYTREREPGGHFKDPDRLVVDAFYVVKVWNLKTALEVQQAKV
jgi:hypothetical protein